MTKVTQDSAINCTNKPALFTRADYMNKVCNHEQYYQQFVTEGAREWVARSGLTLASKLSEWDSVAGRISVPRELMVEAKEVSPRGYPSLACMVTIAKTAYRMNCKAEAG